MRYTTHGLMTGLDLTEHHRLYDTGPNPYCPGHDADAGDGYGMHYYCAAAGDDCPDDIRNEPEE
jgi:hypothetical protein